MNKTIGRFEIRRELGHGAQSTVYLAWDAQLQREVAIKTLHFSQADAARNATLLQEARTVGRLRHPNIVPIFDAGEAGGDPYLVFAYIAGPTLEARLRDGGPLPPAEAVQMMLGILDALENAHVAGVIHRDLKPSNILLDVEAKPMVMDFGIAQTHEQAREAAMSDGLSGTPRFLPPEYLSARYFDLRGDIYAAGLVFLELLTAEKAFQAATLPQLIDSVVNEGLRLPDDLVLDPQLANVIMKATQRDPALRYASAKEMRVALQAYLEVDLSQPAQLSTRKQATMAFLLRRMRHKSDFPALSQSVSAVNRLADSDRESIATLAATILKDYALTNKILRIANSAFYRQASGGSICTISRAVVVLGFDAVRNIAITVLLFEHLRDRGNLRELRETFLRANLAALLARNLTRRQFGKSSEQAFICALFHTLGELLALYYFPDETEQIRCLMVHKACSLERAAVEVLGVSLEELGVEVARSWGFPADIVRSMYRLPEGILRKPTSQEEHHHMLVGFAHELCEAIAGVAPDKRQESLRGLQQRFSSGVNCDERQVREMLDESCRDLQQLAAVLQAGLKQSQFMRHLQVWSGQSGAAAKPSEVDFDADTLLEAEPQLGDGMPPEAGGVDAAAYAQSILTAGIQDISNSLVEERSLNDILQIILETMYRAMGFKRVILCLRDTRSQSIQGRFGFGPEANEVARHFRIAAKMEGDVFSVAVARGLDIIISDVDEAKIADRLPEWYRRQVGAHTFVLFPLLIKGSPVGVIYCDKDAAGSIRIDEKVLALLKTLRNQALLAIKQSA